MPLFLILHGRFVAVQIYYMASFPGGRWCHMLYFHQVQFRLCSYSMLPCTSNLFPTQLHTSLISFIIIQVVFILSLIFLSVLHSFLSSPFCSSFQPPPVLFCDHFLYLAYLFIILCLCMWISFVCDLSVPCYILPIPSLTIACDISYISFHSYLHRYDYSIYVQLHI